MSTVEFVSQRMSYDVYKWS